MADNKKYYYLKLKENFFESDEAIILESMPDGYIYSNILLKLYLRSLKNDGLLMFNNLIPYNAQMLATITRHQVGTIEKAVQIFKDLQLIEVLDNGAIYMTNIQNFVGKSSSDADRKRAYRSKGQMSLKSPELSPPEIEIEKETELDIDIEKEKEIEIEIDTPSLIIANHCQNHGLFIDGQQLQMLADFHVIDGMHIDVVCRAVTEAADNGKRNLKYILAILRNWKADGITTLSQVEDRERQRMEQKSNGYQARPNQTNVPDWADKPVEKCEPTAEEKARLEELKAQMMSREG